VSERIHDLVSEFEREKAGSPDFDPLSEVTAILSAIPDRTRFLNALLMTARRCFLADHGAILSHHRPTGRWFLEASYGLEDDAIEEIKGLSWTVIEKTTRQAQSLLIRDATTNELTRESRSIRAYNILSVLTAPISDASGLWGLVYLDNASIPDAFDSESERGLQRFADFAGIAIQRCEEIVRLSRPQRFGGEGPSPEEPACFDFLSPKMLATMAPLQRAAATDVPVLLVGETGTGKDFLARWVHDHSKRKEGPFAYVNCANIPDNLVESELFGIESRVATGVDFQEGRLKLADGGTVFLNEIGELPLSIQAKTLRVIEEKMLDRVGGKSPVGVDVRFVCATNRDLAAMVEKGTFRRDLYYRINIFEAKIPPLRDRIEDIPCLATHILNHKCRQHGRRPMRIPKTTMAQICSLPWIGNIRELANVIERGVILTDGDEFRLDPLISLPAADNGAPVTRRTQCSLPDAVKRYEVQEITSALREAGWLIQTAASRLGIPASTLRSKMSKYHLKSPKRHL